MLTISNPKMIDEVVAKFFIKNISTFSGETDYESLNETTQEFYANFATLTTTLSDLKHGYVGLIMKYTLYTILTMGTP